MEHPSPTPAAQRLTRRGLLGTAAWGVPVVALTSAAPAFADSPTPEVVASISTGGIWLSNGRGDIDFDAEDALAPANPHRENHAVGRTSSDSVNPTLHVSLVNVGTVTLRDIRVFIWHDEGLDFTNPPEFTGLDLAPRWSYHGSRHLTEADVAVLGQDAAGRNPRIGRDTVMEFRYLLELEPGEHNLRATVIKFFSSTIDPSDPFHPEGIKFEELAKGSWALANHEGSDFMHNGSRIYSFAPLNTTTYTW